MNPATSPLSDSAQASQATGDKRLLRALRRQPVDRPPFWFMRQAGRYLAEYRAVRATTASFLDFCYSPEKATEVTLQPVHRFGMDAAIIFSDILVIPDALGQAVSFEQGRGPVLKPIARLEDLPSRTPGALQQHLAPVYEAIRLTKRALPADVALIGFAGAPWTLASYMVEGGSTTSFEKLKAFAYGRPEAFGALIERLSMAVADHLIAQVEAGAEALQLFDSWAGVLPESHFRRWCIAPAAAIVKAVKARHPQVPIIGFPNRCGVLYEAYAAETGVDAVSIDTTVPPAWARDRLQLQVTVQGNLDPMMVVQGGPAMLDEAKGILAALASGPFVFNLGHGMPPSTPPDHVARLAELLKTTPA